MSGHAGVGLLLRGLLDALDRLGVAQILLDLADRLLDIQIAADIGQDVEPVGNEDADAQRRERRAEQNEGDHVPPPLAALFPLLQIVEIHGVPPNRLAQSVFSYSTAKNAVCKANVPETGEIFISASFRARLDIVSK